MVSAQMTWIPRLVKLRLPKHFKANNKGTILVTPLKGMYSLSSRNTDKINHSIEKAEDTNINKIDEIFNRDVKIEEENNYSQFQQRSEDYSRRKTTMTLSNAHSKHRIP